MPFASKTHTLRTRLGPFFKPRSRPRSFPYYWPRLGGGGSGISRVTYRPPIPSMQSETPDRAPSAPDDDTLSQGNKRRRTSERSTRTPQDLELANAQPMGSRTLINSPQRGSSRDMTPPESAGSIKYTRTGRVSKATKGQRVHHCDECGKVSCHGISCHHLVMSSSSHCGIDKRWSHRTAPHPIAIAFSYNRFSGDWS